MVQRTCAWSAIGLLICGMLLTSSAAAAQGRIITPDSSASIVVPQSWHPMQLNELAALQLGDPAAEVYNLIFVEGREDLVGWNLTRHSMITLAQMLTNLDLPEVSGPDSLIIDGHPAVQYEIRGTGQGMRIAYLQTTIESPQSFTRVVGWTLSSRWAINEQALRDAAATVQLAAAPGTLPDNIYTIVPGTWAWESDEQPCAGKTQRFEIGADGVSMRIHHSEPIESTTGEMSSVTEYVIENDAHHVLHTSIPGESRLTDAGEPVKWDLVVVGRNRIAWHRTDWPDGALTGMLRRCELT